MFTSASVRPRRSGEKEDRLLRSWNTSRNGSALYVVGDLFDFWFDYRTVIPKGFHRTLTALQAFTDARIPVHFLAGNHDYWIGDFFEKELKVQVHLEAVRSDDRGKTGVPAPWRRTRAERPRLPADQAGPAEPALHRRLPLAASRHRGAARARLLPHQPAVHLRKGFRGGGGDGCHAQALIGTGIDIVVMGHRHRPELLTLGNGVYINLGDWITHFTYGSLNTFGMRLETWSDREEPPHGR